MLFAIGEAITGEPLIVGSGYQVLAWVGDPGRSAWVILAVLVLRGLATSATVAGGGVGGLFVPLVVAGALTGALIGNLVNPGDLDLFIVIGVAAFLGAGYRVPLAAVMFVAETTGRPVVRRPRPHRRRRRRAAHGPGIRDRVPARPRHDVRG